ncbi:phosphate propanoyltransferase [Neobacillus sp. LXY-1]|uniref:phosphate propanoyltransferase n=1 Tax=Neobacillus sp. LXY-1 TaxID=3379133 RepID=UPI003EE23D0D
MTLITEKTLRQLWTKQKLDKEFMIHEGDVLTPAARDFLTERNILVRKNNLIKKEEVPEFMIPVGVSNRHAHLSETHFKKLFGEGALLKEWKTLSQPGQFAASETVTIVGPAGVIRNVRILGPFRNETQIEISRTDGFVLGVHPPVRLSGSIEGTPGITIVGPRGSVTIESGLIVAKNHVHMTGKDAEIHHVNHGDTLMLTSKNRAVIFQQVIVRVKDSYCLDFHIDQDEANAAGLATGDVVRVVGKNGRIFSPFLGVDDNG